MKKLVRTTLWVLAIAALPLTWGPIAVAQNRVTTPKEALGFNIGDDYHLATYTQFVDYWTKLAAESPRMVVQEIGKTAEGRPQLMAIITSPENHRRLARYKDIAQRLAHAEGLTDSEARALAKEGKAVVWFDGGLHATEVLGAHQLMETVYQLVSAQDEETMRFLNDLIILAVHANPDGMDLVSNWYMREQDPMKRSTGGIPRLYQKYIGHDNNRDFYMVTQPETQNMTRILFQEWFPQIMYNHHQTGPAGTVLFAPPFRDPFNYNFDPLVPLTIDAVGAAMHSRFVAEGKPGSTLRRGSSYSTWWNGGLRTVTYFHNMVGLLTETIGNPTPIEIPFIPEKQLPSSDLYAPIAPQEWHFRQSVDYSVTANKAVFDYASRYRETLLYNIYLMGRNSIERGGRDSWTVHPKVIQEVQVALANEPPSARQNQGFRGARSAPKELYDQILRDPAKRDPRGYILPSNQADFPTATKFVNTLIRNGVTVERATRDFTVAGKQYPAGSYVVEAAQAFRPHILDMFEPQDHPNDFQYPGGPPIPPYDNAGWTLAYLMGINFDRILDGFTGPFQKIDGLATPMAGTVANARGAVGFLLSHDLNDGFVATNRLLKDGDAVYWLRTEMVADGKTWPAGTVYIPAGSGTARKLERMATELGLTFQGINAAPSVDALQMRPVRVALWDRYGGSMPSGWTRWLLEQFEFPFEVVYPQTLDAGNLKSKYDVIVFPTDAIPEVRASGGQGGFGFGQPPESSSIPQEYRGWLGRVTPDRTIPQLAAFLEAGGTVITIGTSTNLAYHLKLPVQNHLLGADGMPLSREDYYMPGSVHQVRVDNTLPIAWGMGQHADVFFDDSPVFKLPDTEMSSSVKPVAWFDTSTPLRSGWAWGQHYLAAGVAMAQADVGAGKLYMFGPEILNRGQPHGTFKFFFNGVYLAGATPVSALQTTSGSN